MSKKYDLQEWIDAIRNIVENGWRYGSTFNPTDNIPFIIDSLERTAKNKGLKLENIIDDMDLPNSIPAWTRRASEDVEFEVPEGLTDRIMSALRRERLIDGTIPPRSTDSGNSVTLRNGQNVNLRDAFPLHEPPPYLTDRIMSQVNELNKTRYNWGDYPEVPEWKRGTRVKKNSSLSKSAKSSRTSKFRNLDNGKQGGFVNNKPVAIKKSITKNKYFD